MDFLYFLIIVLFMCVDVPKYHLGWVFGKNSLSFLVAGIPFLSGSK
jgi:hypothetical protein